jgi:hypothetical protein
MKTILKITGTTLAAFLIFWGCNNGEKTVSPPLPGNEFLTSVQLIATNASDGSDVQTAIITDTTIISNPPASIQNPVLNLKANSTYHVAVKFLDETKTPAGDVTTDIYDRRNYHLVCFDVSGANLTVTRTDLDTNNPPLQIGLKDDFATGAASTGTLNVQLRHQPNAKNGDCAPGSSDADVTFTIKIK